MRLRWPSLRWRAAPTPVGPPIEQIAATLRRLQHWLDIYADPTPLPGKATRVAAAMSAYDRVLIDACQALAVAEFLDDTQGFEHDVERLRVQHALADAGLMMTN